MQATTTLPVILVAITKQRTMKAMVAAGKTRPSFGGWAALPLAQGLALGLWFGLSPFIESSGVRGLIEGEVELRMGLGCAVEPTAEPTGGEVAVKVVLGTAEEVGLLAALVEGRSLPE